MCNQALQITRTKSLKKTIDEGGNFNPNTTIITENLIRLCKDEEFIIVVLEKMPLSRNLCYH